MLKVLIVDDEPLARELLETYLAKMPGCELIGKCAHAREAFDIINSSHCDLVLLDINMPEISGIDLLKTLKDPPQVIFTTAYSQYAVESYELNVADYLLKPITFDRFAKAMHKVKTQDHKDAAPVKTIKETAGKDDLIFVRSDSKMIKTDLSKLWFVEGLKNYVRLWTDDGKIIVHTTMKNIEQQLAGNAMFVRINRSYIVNLKYVSESEGNMIRIKSETLVIGNTYRDEVRKIFEHYNLL